MCLEINPADVALSLHAATDKLDGAGDLVLDFSSVRRIDSRALEALEKLAGVAGGKGVKLMLRGVNIDIYKALKLAKLAPVLAFAA